MYTTQLNDTPLQIFKTPKVEKATGNLKCWMALGVNITWLSFAKISGVIDLSLSFALEFDDDTENNGSGIMDSEKKGTFLSNWLFGYLTCIDVLF